MRVVVVHDYLTQRGGAERVALELIRAFPESRLETSFYAPHGTYPEFAAIDITASRLNRVPFFAADPRRALPILSDLFRRRSILDADVVVCSSAGFAHEVQPDVPKVVYCHNPPRWLHQERDYGIGLGLAGKGALRLMKGRLARLDREGAASAAGYVANSRNVAGRIRQAYGLDAAVIHPPRGVSPGGDVEVVRGLEPGFLLTVGRPRGYKRTNLLAEAVAGMPGQTLVTVGSRPDGRLPSNIKPLVDVTDAQLRWLYQSAAALLACSYEDFGLTPVEAFGFGTPVGATAEGGYLETCAPGLTGEWLDPSSVESMQKSIMRLLGQNWDRGAIVEHGDRWTAESFRAQMSDYVRSVA